jgi:hypothetical protein
MIVGRKVSLFASPCHSVRKSLHLVALKYSAACTQLKELEL